MASFFSGSLRLLLVLSTLGTAHARTIEVPPGPASNITAALAQAAPGDVVQLSAGTYTGTVDVTVSGAPDQAVTIAGPSGNERAVIDGQGKPAKGQSNQAFRLNGVSWIVIRDIDARNCWTNIVDIRDSSYISVVGCRFIECGNTAVAASGPATHHILIEGCTWSQDARIFSTWDWDETHHLSLDHYNGGLYGGSNAAGGAVIRSNTIHDVFNGLRWWLSEKDGAERRYQSNIEIYDNTFYRCRDNCIEPEVFTWNLHIYHNRLNSCPSGIFSIDRVTGGEIFIYGNTGYWNPANQPGPKGGSIPQPTSWATYKFSNYDGKGLLDAPLFIYHNSFSYDRTFPRGSKVRKAQDHLVHYNNAYFHQTGTMGLDEWPGQDCRFDYDISSKPWSPDVIKFGFEQHGIPDTDPKFLAPQKDDFNLASDSRAIDAAKVIDGFTLWYSGQAPDMGAREGDQPVYGMPFLHRDPPGGALYKEMPRIVRIFSRDNRLAIFFSAPLAEISPDSVRLAAAGVPLAVSSAQLAGESRVISVVLDQPLPPELEKLDITFGPKPPKGQNGQTATLWAADNRVVRIPADATLAGPMTALFAK